MITVYSTGCPKCKILEKKLGEKGIEYEINNNTDEMFLLGLEFLPVMKVDNELLDFKQSVDWINGRN